MPPKEGWFPFWFRLKRFFFATIDSDLLVRNKFQFLYPDFCKTALWQGPLLKVKRNWIEIKSRAIVFGVSTVPVMC